MCYSSGNVSSAAMVEGHDSVAFNIGMIVWAKMMDKKNECIPRRYEFL